MAGFKRQILADDAATAGAVILGVLADRQTDVFCRCQRCGHTATVDAGQLSRQLGPDLSVAEIGTRMRCGGCGSKDVATMPGWPTAMRHGDVGLKGLPAAS